ncbi:MAG: alpha/beta fold hydrolase [Chloroflexi bacterium]|nr:alpha/beta fold hydrolase [Chloroflexota bacterium]
MPYIERSSVRIYYEDNGSGPPILLSHGYGATSAMWGGQVAEFADRYRLITWDMLGHGESDSPADATLYSEAETLADMAAILDEVKVSKAVVGGLSLGGYMSLAFHRTHPERVHGLLLFDTGPGYRNPDGREAWNDRAERRALSFEKNGLASVEKGGQEVRMSRHRSAQGLAHSARGMLKQFDSSVIDSMAEIGVPTLVLIGERDTPFIAATDFMAAKIPGATKVVIPDAGHAANIDQPKKFNEAVATFLDPLGSWS